MIDIVCVQLKGNISPSGNSWHRGVIRQQDSTGVTIGVNEYSRDKLTFYPWCQVQRIEYNG